MACCLMAPTPKWTNVNSSLVKFVAFTWEAYNELENYTFEITTTNHRGQCVTSPIPMISRGIPSTTFNDRVWPMKTRFNSRLFEIIYRAGKEKFMEIMETFVVINVISHDLALWDTRAYAARMIIKFGMRLNTKSALASVECQLYPSSMLQ